MPESTAWINAIGAPHHEFAADVSHQVDILRTHPGC